MTSQRILYHLTAQDDFRCLARDCPASCCSGWQIAVEPELVERWKTLPDAADRERFPALVRIETQGASTQLFMTGRDNPHCGLLTTDGLCEVHTRYGVGYTPLTCRAFPRMQEETRVIRMESASPACPVIARRVVINDTGQPLYTRTQEEQVEPTDPRERAVLLLSGLLDRLFEENQFPVGVRLFWLAERIGPLQPGAELDEDTLTAFDPTPEAMRQQLKALDDRHRNASLRPDPVIAGSFWNTLYQLGHARGLLPEPVSRDSALRAGLRGLPTDRRRFYATVYAEVQAARQVAALDRLGWYRPAANRLLQLQLLNAGFPWQPSLDDYRMSFVHAVMLYALTNLQLWLNTRREPMGAEDMMVVAIYRTGRSFGHNTVILEQIRANPALMDLHRYHATWLDL
jgi:hypothetical protein